jgi:hypothetical protein
MWAYVRAERFKGNEFHLSAEQIFQKKGKLHEIIKGFSLGNELHK